MLNNYVVSCPCGAATGCDPPSDKDYVPIIECIVCNQRLDASKGWWSIRPIRVKEPEEINLLAVE